MKKYLLAALTIILFSCSKEDSTDNPPTTNAIAYFKASLNGQAFNYTQTDYSTSAYSYNFYNGFKSGPGYFDKSYSFGCFMQPSNVVNSYPQISLTFSNMYNTI